MPKLFSFITQPIIGLMDTALELIPGVEKIVAIYYDSNLHALQCKTKSFNTRNDLAENLHISNTQSVQKLRDSKIRFNWLNANNLPFETTRDSKQQFQIFDELEHVVLSIGLPNAIDGKTDILYIYLNHNKGNFGIAHGNKPLSTDEKAIVGAMTYNSLQSQLNRLNKDAQTLRTVNKRVTDIKAENDRLSKEIEFLKEQHQIQLIAACNNVLENLSQAYGINLSLASDAKHLLKSFTGSIDQLKQQLHHSAEMAINLNFGNQNNSIILRAWDLNLGEIDTPKANLDAPVQERYQKAWGLLEKLENAAQSVIKNQQKLTSENVGNACPTPISAPAISDALKNHHRKVVSLMEKFPNKWGTIRAEFRPVKNILQENAS